MNLYAFVPTGIGPARFYVMAENEDEAWKVAEDKVMAELAGSIMVYGKPFDAYDLKIYGPGEVVEDGLCQTIF